jgi:hypothetical protein
MNLGGLKGSGHLRKIRFGGEKRRCHSLDIFLPLDLALVAGTAFVTVLARTCCGSTVPGVYGGRAGSEYHYCLTREES